MLLIPFPTSLFAFRPKYRLQLQEKSSTNLDSLHIFLFVSLYILNGIHEGLNWEWYYLLFC